jgi:5-oxoprolinase (ATP-hydrolysing) subunit A
MCSRCCAKASPKNSADVISSLRSIDLNCDLGEGGGHDAALMPLVTSANVACGGHAGDEATMRAAIEGARQHGVSVGAHPGFADRDHFGRRELSLTPCALHDLVTWQIDALRELGTVRHVKPHGALYNLAARDRGVAEVIAEAVYACDRTLILYGLAGSELLRAGRERGLRVASEVFADRSYQSDGSLTPRTQADALLHDPEAVVAQVLRMVREGRVRSIDGGDIAIAAETVCLHGDGAQALVLARRLKRELESAEIAIRAITP